MDSDVTQSTAFYNFLAWVEVNKKRLLGWGGVIAAIAAITSIFVYSQVQKVRAPAGRFPKCGQDPV